MRENLDKIPEMKPAFNAKYVANITAHRDRYPDIEEYLCAHRRQSTIKRTNVQYKIDDGKRKGVVIVRRNGDVKITFENCNERLKRELEEIAGQN